METGYDISNAKESAADFVEENVDSIVEQLISAREAGTFPEAYNEQWDESIVGEMSFVEACLTIDNLDRFEETDTGLWGESDFKKAAKCCAHYTYRNAVSYFIQKLIERINNDLKVSAMLDKHDAYLEWEEDGNDEGCDEVYTKDDLTDDLTKYIERMCSAEARHSSDA